MLNVFPEFLTFSLFAPFILRVVVGIIFFDLGMLNFKQIEMNRWANVMETIGLRPGIAYAKIFGGIQIIGGILLITGLFTQVAAIVFATICLAEIWIERRSPEILKRNIVFYILLFAISLSLLLSGAGFFALDLPL